MKRFVRASIVTAAVITGALAAAPIAAKEVAIDPGRSAVVQALSDCRKVTEDGARLACYDKAAGALDQAESKGQLVVIDREQAKAVRRQAFGLNLPTLHIFDRNMKGGEEGFDHLNLDLASVHRSAEGRWVMVSTDGAIWRQTDDQEIVPDPHQGSHLLIKNGMLGSFFCKVDGQPQVRCARQA